jgi:hypothetical protein
VNADTEAERERLIRDLSHKIETIIACSDELNGSVHLAMADLQFALSSPDSVPCINMLRLYDKYLSVTYSPMVIRNALAGLHSAVCGSELIGWELVPISVYESVTRAHMDAFITGAKRFKEHHNAFELARLAAGHPNKIEHLSELVSRGIEDEKQLIAAMREIDFGVTRALYEGAL